MTLYLTALGTRVPGRVRQAVAIGTRRFFLEGGATGSKRAIDWVLDAKQATADGIRTAAAVQRIRTRRGHAP